MPAQFTIPLQTVIPGQLITAALWNNEYENIDTNFTPDGMDDASVNDTDFEADTDPYPGSVNSRPTNLTGEIRRLRFVVRGITGKSKWHHDPDVDIATFKTRFDAHTHDGTANNGPQIQAAGLASNAVTTAKILDANVTDAKIVSLATSKLTGQISNSQIADDAITAAKIAADAVGSSEIAAGAVGSSELASDAVQTAKIGDAQVTYAKLASDVTDKLSPKSIQRLSDSITFSSEVGAKTKNVAISSVNTAKSYVILNGKSGSLTSGGVVNPIGASAQLTSATNVQISVSNESGSNGSGTITVYFTVVEWN